MSTLVGDQLATLVEDVASEITFDYWGVGGATEHYYTQFDSSVYLIQAKKFHPKSIDMIDRICRLTDGATAEKYTLN